MAIARISDIRGLVTIGGEGEEILKNRDLISDHGGILTISEFAKIIFEDGREVEVTGPVSFNLDSSFFNEGTFEDSITQISDLASLEYVNNIIDETNIEDIIIPSELEQVETNNEIQSEQLDTTVENNNDNDPLETQTNNIENEPIDITNELTEEETETENPQVPEVETPVEPEPEIPVEPEGPADTSVLAPTITVESTGEDSVYNSEELGADGTVTATISLPSDAAAGDILTINGENQTLTQDDIDAGSVTKEVNPDTTVTASITDAAGNTSSQASQTVAPADTSVLAPTITVESTGEDSVYNSEELGADGTVTATISLPSDAAAGDILTINGENQTLTQDDIDAGSVTKEVNPDTTVTASITDAAGNTSSQASQTVAPADTSVLAPTITVESTGEDSVYNSEELGADGTVTATISLPSDAAAGDILTINGENQTLTQDDIDAGSVTKEVNPDTTVTASITDAAGNTSSQASQTVAPADTEATITVDTEFVEGGDGFTYDVGNGGRNANNINANSTEEALNVANGNNGEIGDLVFGNVNNSSFNLDNTDDVFVVQGNANNVNLNLNGGDNTVIFEKNPGAININASYGDDVLVLPGNQNDYDFSNLNDNNGILSGQILGPNNTVITINNFDAISFGDGTSLGDSSIIPTDGNDVLEINGTTNDVEPGQTVKIVVTDENNNSIETTAIVQEDGTYSTEVDTDGLGGELSTSVEVFDKAGNKAENSDAISIDIEAGEPTVSIEVGDAIPTVIETEVVDSDANSEAGIYEKDGKFYQEQETSVVDVEALRELGYTMDSDGKFFKINEDDAKVLIEQEKTREVTKIVDTDPIMKEATETTTFETVGQAHVDEGAIVYKKSGVNFDFEQPTSNVELSFSNFDTGTAKVSFYDENGNQVGSSINTNHTNDTQGYSVPDGAVGVRVYNNTGSGNFEVDTISYRGESGEVTVEAGGLIPDYEAMAEEGIFWSNTESKNLEQTQDIKNIGNVGNGNVRGFNPEDHEQSQVFDFGTDMANRKVTITVDMQVKGSWDNNSSSTNDYFSVSANGQEIDVNHYSNRSWGHESDDVEYIGWDNKENFTYEYEVYLDENGQVQLDFMVASTASNEVVNIKNIEVDYEGETGWQKEVTETETYTESVLVDAPAEEVDPSEIPGGIPYISDEVEVDPIMTTEQEVVEYTYSVDISSALSDVDGSESLSVMITNVPEGGELSLGTNNGDGTWTIEVPEGNTSISESLTLTVPDEMEDFELGVTATSYETVSDDINSVTDSDLVDIPADDELELDFNLLSSLNEDTQDEEESISEVTQLNLQDMLSSNGADESLSSLLGDESSESKSDSNSLENNEKNESSEDQSQVQSAFDKLQEASSNLMAQSENEITISDDEH
ncbi:hypothetical protein CRV03_02585 [Arcobacter sp. F155]|uniref:hypothetical protein n=1 Tax=Arcobacter sp. F155 TaxID=2044512 RepID=UPI00100BBAFB|nr:hypothetical protein [Arcobacter sp. F155]RXJ77876.1 hypothetical protein CRV03_02585 [Arcobacter sp. F155]